MPLHLATNVGGNGVVRAMRGIVGTVLTLAALALSAPAASAAIPPGNLTGNPSFEVDSAGWSSYNGTVSRVAPRLDAPDGMAVARVTADPGVDGYTIDDDADTVSSASGGRTYTASAYVQAGSPSSIGKDVTLIVRQRFADDSTSRCAQSAPVPLGATYQQVTVSCVATHSGDRLDVYLARQGDVAPSEYFYADAITLVAPPLASIPGDNLTANPSFESGTGNWMGYHSSITAVTPADGDAPDGTQITRVTAEPTTGGSYSIDDDADPVPVAAGAHVYHGSAWVRGTSSSDGKTAQVIVRETTADGTATVQEQRASITLTKDRFQRISVSAAAQATGNRIDVYVARIGGATSGESFLVDAVTLTRSAPATIPSGNLTPNPSFADGVTNWISFQGHVTQLTGQDDAPHGTTVGRVVADATRTYDAFSVDDDTATVASAEGGHTYSASAWAKAGAPPAGGAPPKVTVLIVRETDGDGDEVGRAQSSPVTLTDERYRRLTADYVAKDPGNAIDVYVSRQGDVTTGETFYVDAITLTATPIASVFGSSETLRPDLPSPAGGTPDAELVAAKNETASFQVDLRTTGVPMSISAAITGDLDGPGSATIPASAVTLSRQGSYEVVTPTDGEGATGRWPDALVPDRDPLLGGDGGAFPIVLAAHDAGAIWIDVAVPDDAVAGTYSGALRLTRAGANPTLVDVPVELTVRPFALPSTSSLRSIFMLNPWEVCAVRPGYDGGYTDLAKPDGSGCDPQKEGAWRLFNRFARLGLRNRITIANPYLTPQMRAPSTSTVTPSPARPGAPTTEAAAFDTYVTPLLDGTAGQGTLPGAQLTALTTQWLCILDPGAGRNCTADWKTFLTTHAPGAADRFVPWVCDEPAYAGTMHQTPWAYRISGPSSPHAPCEDLRTAARTGWPGVPVKITTPIDDPGLYPGQVVDPPNLDDSAVEVLAPDVPSLVTRAGGSTRNLYDPFLGHAGTSLWLYLACTSGGCDGGQTDPVAIADPEHDGWPSYSIDQPGSQASAMGWLAFMYDVAGESYFDVASGFAKGPDFQHGIETFGTNGDGLLFYPGHVEVSGPGGATVEDMPFESIRLKRIREGREDHEYLQLLEACGRRSEAMAVAEGLFGDLDHAMFQTTVSQAQLDDARQALADLIVQHGCG
ncbi:MAG: DUF4091 domain-containing protein [Patulibacter sp.]|nr:DUF4091 domain-containing protein [Patulibacter sp.]